MDVVEVQEPLTPSEWTENVPEVEFGAEGESPTVTIPDTEPSTELQMHIIEEGDGDTVAAGDSVTAAVPGHQLGHRRGLRRELRAASPRRSRPTQVIQGFGAALVGQKVGTKLIVTIPPELAYGTDPAAHELGGQTLVFLVEIEGTEPPAEGTEPPSE